MDASSNAYAVWQDEPGGLHLTIRCGDIPNVIRNLAMLAVLLICVNCGDPGYSVTVANQAGTTVVFFVEGVNAKAGTAMAEGTMLAPGTSDVNHWVVPSGSNDSRVATVRAVGLTGVQLYCHRFGWEELKRIRFHIDLTLGVSDCF